jgi:hypothetical protein
MSIKAHPITLRTNLRARIATSPGLSIQLAGPHGVAGQIRTASIL